jgi:hypothetical protein
MIEETADKSTQDEKLVVDKTHTDTEISKLQKDRAREEPFVVVKHVIAAQN